MPRITNIPPIPPRRPITRETRELAISTVTDHQTVNGQMTVPDVPRVKMRPLEGAEDRVVILDPSSRTRPNTPIHFPRPLTGSLQRQTAITAVPIQTLQSRALTINDQYITVPALAGTSPIIGMNDHVQVVDLNAREQIAITDPSSTDTKGLPVAKLMNLY